MEHLCLQDLVEPDDTVEREYNCRDRFIECKTNVGWRAKVKGFALDKKGKQKVHTAVNGLVELIIGRRGNIQINCD